MHGLVAMELRRWTEEVAGPDAWQRVQQATGPLPADDPLVRVPNDALDGLIAAVADVTGLTVDGTLEAFGRVAAPRFLELHQAAVDPSWRTLDLLEHSEAVMHRAVRVHDSTARPPLLRPRRRSETVVEVFYGSPARLCALARGLIHGYADHYGEEVLVLEPQCMHRGDGVCRFDVELKAAPTAAQPVGAGMTAP